MRTEERLRAILRDEASRVHVSGSFDDIEARIANPAAPRRRVAWVAAAALVLAMMVSLLVQTRARTTTPLASNQSTNAAAPFAWPPPKRLPESNWPPVSRPLGYATPQDVAVSFVQDFLGMSQQRSEASVGAFSEAAADAGTISVRPLADYGATTLQVRRDTYGWHVVSAESKNMRIDEPSTGNVSSPITVTGRAASNNGFAHVAVMRYGTTMHCTVNEGLLPNACGSDPSRTGFYSKRIEATDHFEVSLPFTGTPGEYGYVVVWTTAPELDAPAEVAVRVVRFT